MIRIVEAVLSALQLGAGSHRPMDETLADWRHELTVSRGGVRRAVTHVRGAAAATTVLAKIACAQVGEYRSWSLALSVLLLAAACTVANVTAAQSGVRAPATMLDAFPEFALILSAVLPARGRTASEWLGAAAILGAAVFAFSGWLAPVLLHGHNESFRQNFGAQLADPNLYELTLPAVAQVARHAGWESGLAVIRLNTLVAMAWLPPLLVCLGLSARHFATAIHRPRFSVPLALLGAVSVFFLAEELMRSSASLGDTSTFARATVHVVSFWSHLLFALVEIGVLISLADASNRERISSWVRHLRA